MTNTDTDQTAKKNGSLPKSPVDKILNGNGGGQGASKGDDIDSAIAKEQSRADYVWEESKKEAGNIDSAFTQLADIQKHRPDPKQLEGLIAEGRNIKPANRDPITAIGSIGFIAAALLSLASRRPLLGAMGALTAAVKSRKAGDDDAFKQAMETWKTQTDFAIKQFQLEDAAYQDALAELGTNVKLGEAKLAILSYGLRDDNMANLLQAKRYDEMMNLEVKRAEIMAKYGDQANDVYDQMGAEETPSIDPTVDVTEASGKLSYAGEHMLNEALGAAGLPLAAPREMAAEEAIKTMRTAALGLLKAEVPGRNSVFMVQQLQQLLPEAGEPTETMERRLTDTSRFLGSEAARIDRDILSHPNAFTKAQLAQARTNRSGLIAAQKMYQRAAQTAINPHAQPPDGFKQAPDGNWYSEQPDATGKFHMWTPPQSQ